ncbi:MAG: glutaminyl-peptide cyclotransferase [Solirubrobacteraceae bacterium]|nr:glutaminyl-peptide cyclotransferase [Solirubrobacteraceae bacterium]
MARSNEPPGTGGLSVRILVVALIMQLVLGAGLVVLAVNGFPMLGGGGGETAPPDARAAGAPAPVPKARIDRFDEVRAFRLLRRQVAVGRRPAGSPELRALAEELRPMLPGGRFEDVPGNPGLRNVVGVLPGRRPAIVVGAHYDSEFHPPGFVGANDSAAGTAAVVELSRALRALPRPRGAREMRFVLFDGEEEPPGSKDFLKDALRGSKAYVAAHKGEIGSLVLLDYVANKGLRIPREGSSDRALWAQLRAAARRAGVLAVFPAGRQTGIYDDHTPFLQAGIPAIDLIDFSYRYRDTVDDTPDKLSPRSLDAVGETVLELVRTMRAR